MSPRPFYAPVAIVGGGPVGLMLALFLDRHNVKSVVFNWEETTRWHPKGSTHNSRTMEHYRRLGIGAQVRQLGLPQDHPTDVVYLTRFYGRQLAQVRMPSSIEKLRAVIAAPCNHQNFEPIHRANQMYVEKFLLEHARTRPNISLRFGWELGEFREDATGVSLQVERVSPAAAPAETWQAEYMVGADGGQSQVRRGLGIRYGGQETLKQAFLGGSMMSTHIRAPSLVGECFANRRGYQYWAINPDVRLTMVNLNGVDEYMFFTPVPEGANFDEQLAIRTFHRACGQEAPVTVLGNRLWTAGVALWADRFWSGERIFLAGDAIHLFTPTGGFGLNTGIDGAGNLAWKLAALVQGWGGQKLKASYEAERRPIAKRNTTAAQMLAKNVGDVEIRPQIEAVGPAGDAARKSAGDYLDTFGEEFASIGVQLGVRYDGSPIIFEDGTPPRDSINCYTPSGVPGGRAPHYFIDPPGMAHRRSLFDRFGVGFTLLRFTDQTDGAALIAAAQRRGVPLEVVDVADADARDLYGRDLVLIRPDQHICWRGDRLPADCAALIAKAVGAD
ncbi:MAG: monooxygenase [Betaproteobacteria bacterium]|nr:monooxygenase [Betaproteobacteria bacterium]MSQ89235.1 monooxygenase [Betaproteobacteria bacterium]